MALARKYRPQTFEALIGQPHVTATLARALAQGRPAQAYLFTGQRGVGKTSAARIVAKCLNCAARPTGTPCNACASCEQITQGRSLDVVEIDGASNRGIDEVRSLREMVPFAPVGGAYRVYIIDEVHMLTMEAFNALLKTLEEPPAHVVFVLATTAAGKVPPTVLSRCQRFDFRRIEATRLVHVLGRVANEEGLAVDTPALYAIAREADGSLRDAEVLLEQVASAVEGPITEETVTALLGAVESDVLWRWADAILARDVPRTLGTLREQLELGKDPQQLLASLIRHVRNLLMARSVSDAATPSPLLSRLVEEPPEQLTRLQAQARPVAPEELALMLQLLTGAHEILRKSGLATTMLELTVLKLATREEWRSLAQISGRLEQLSQGVEGEEPAGVQAIRPDPPSAVPALEDAPEPGLPPEGGEAPDAGAGRGSLQELWATCLERVAAKKMSLAAYLAEAKPLRLESDRLIVGVPGVALHQEVVNHPEHLKLLGAVLSELSGRPMGIVYDTLPIEAVRVVAARAGPAVPPVVQDIVKLFNATVVHHPRAAS